MTLSPRSWPSHADESREQEYHTVCTRSRASPVRRVGSATARYGFVNWSDGMPSTPAPERGRRVEIETIVQVHASPGGVTRRSRTASAQPRHHDSDIRPRVRVRESDRSASSSLPRRHTAPRPNIVRSRSLSWPMVTAASARHRSISACFLMVSGCGLCEGWPRLRGFGTNSTSRTHTDTDAFDTPSSRAMSSSVHDSARSWRARSRSRHFPA